MKKQKHIKSYSDNEAWEGLFVEKLLLLNKVHKFSMLRYNLYYKFKGVILKLKRRKNQQI